MTATSNNPIERKGQPNDPFNVHISAAGMVRRRGDPPSTESMSKDNFSRLRGGSWYSASAASKAVGLQQVQVTPKGY
jgi:hypothetical protein